MMFKGAHVSGDQMHVVTNTEVLNYGLNEFQLVDVMTHPSFNDLHAVLSDSGGIYVCNTGLEIVQKFTSSGKLCEEWNIADSPTWRRFDRNTDYRKVASTKPHDVHINHLFEMDGEIWVTLGSRRMARSLTNAERVVDMDAHFGSDEKVLCHDGVVRDGYIYFTSVNGTVLVVDRNSLKVEDRIDFSSEKRVGWTRGVEVVGQKAYIGVTKIRHSKYREYTRWMLTGRPVSMPSSILEVDLGSRSITDVYEMKGFRGCAIYSIVCIG